MVCSCARHGIRRIRETFLQDSPLGACLCPTLLRITARFARIIWFSVSVALITTLFFDLVRIHIAVDHVKRRKIGNPDLGKTSQLRSVRDGDLFMMLHACKSLVLSVKE